MMEHIRTLAASRGMIRSGGQVQIDVAYETMTPPRVTVSALSPGFSCEAQPVEGRAGQQRCRLSTVVRRRNDAKSHVCLLEVKVGELSATLSLTVLPRARTHGHLPAQP